MDKIKLLIVLIVAAMACVSIAATQNNVWTGNAGDNDFNNETNWWNSVTANDVAFFRGDNIAAYPERTNVVLSVPATITAVKFQQSPGASYRISGEELTLDGTAENQTTLLETLSGATFDQTFANSVVLVSANNANFYHVRTAVGSNDVIFAGTLSQTASSAGVGIQIGYGSVIISGDFDGSSKLWKIHDTTGDGVMRFTGSGTYSGAGTFQVNGATLVLDRSSTNSTGFAPGVLQILSGGIVQLGNDEQILDGVALTIYGSNAQFDLNGHTETLNDIKFVSTANTAVIGMGNGGVLRLNNQDSASTWGTLTVTGWDSGVDHIYVDGGSFSALQLAAITFDGYPAGAKVESGELLPASGALGYSGWISGYNLTNGLDAADADPDGDGVKNLYEYGLGGNPTNSAVTGTPPTFEIIEQGGSNVCEYIHVQRTDSSSGIGYTVQQVPNLVIAAWTNNGISIAGESPEVDGFKTVTNRTPVDAVSKFIRLLITEE